MALFYGVYIQDPQVSAALDLIRFIAEPDALRFSHITLRGPYAHELTALQLSQLVASVEGEWSVFLSGPGYFFSKVQNTVMLRVDLNGLGHIVKKPDFKEAVPHITLYDGNDKNFAQSVLGLIYRYDFHRKVATSTLRKIDKKAPLAGSFLEIYPAFREMFYNVIGLEVRPSEVEHLSSMDRLELINRVLDWNFIRHSEKLRPLPQLTLPENLDFGFPHMTRSV